MIKCKDCGLPCDEKTQNNCWTDKHIKDHDGLCCDCFDQKLGMPESRRSVPRPTTKE